MPELRYYQREAIDAVAKDWELYRSLLLVMATGTGKTVTATDIVAREVEADGRILWLAHRDELINQAAKTIRGYLGGYNVEIEKAESRALLSGQLGASPVVVASVQSLRKARLHRFPEEEFSLIVVDEAHHATAITYRKILERFRAAKVLGLTATPDRSDSVALGHVFDHCSYEYDIRRGIADGFLAPIRQKTIVCDELRLGDIKKRHGDLAQNELAAAINDDQVLHQIASPLVEEVGDRQTLVFTPDVASARALGDVIAGYLDGPNPGDRVEVISGGTPLEDRHAYLEGFASGRVQFLINCMVLTEGFDAPATGCVAVARPTTSRSLYTQMIGRGTRIAPGKEHCLVLDFVGNASRHRLVTPFDVLAGRELPEEVAKKAAELGRFMDASEAMEKAEEWNAAREARLREERRLRAEAGVRAKARYQSKDVDPFGLLGVSPTESWAPPATEAQLAYLERKGIKVDPERVNRREASRMIDALIKRQQEDKCTFKQAKLLQSKGLRSDVGFSTASKIISVLAENGWRPTPELLERYGRS